jgi:hypothetical protein
MELRLNRCMCDLPIQAQQQSNESLTFKCSLHRRFRRPASFQQVLQHLDMSTAGNVMRELHVIWWFPFRHDGEVAHCTAPAEDRAAVVAQATKRRNPAHTKVNSDPVPSLQSWMDSRKAPRRQLAIVRKAIGMRLYAERNSWGRKGNEARERLSIT